MEDDATQPENPAPYDAIYLSPHLDDATLSCGGQIYRFTRSGQRVLVVTFMTGAPEEGELSAAAVELHGLWGFGPEQGVGPVLETRCREDEEACRTLGAEHLHAGLIDALYRRRPGSGAPLYSTVKSIFRSPKPADEAQLEVVAKVVAELPEASRVCAPFGIGSHVDHVLVRRAAERVHGRDLEYYEDYPYAHSRKARWKAFGWRSPRGEDGRAFRWESRTWTLGHDAIEAKCRAVRRYSSQIGALFKDEDEMEHKVRVYARRVGGERVWWLAARR